MKLFKKNVGTAGHVVVVCVATTRDCMYTRLQLLSKEDLEARPGDGYGIGMVAG